MALRDCAKGKHALIQIAAGRINRFTGQVEIYHECKFCRFYCYVVQDKVQGRKG